MIANTGTARPDDVVISEEKDTDAPRATESTEQTEKTQKKSYISSVLIDHQVD
jgi:hypothetical protein